MQPWWAVVNPRAGRRGQVAARARRALESRGLEALISVPDRAEDVGRVVHDGIAAGHRRFLAVGGDGTVNLVVDALLRRPWGQPPVLGILPAGSGCDLLRTFALPQQMERAVAHLLGDQTYRADVGLLQGHWGERHFLNVAEAGIGAATVRASRRMPRPLGSSRYRIAFWVTLARFRPSDVELRAGRRSYRGPATNVVFANGQFFGGGLNIAPKANLVDGLLDIQVFTGPLREAPALLRRVRGGLHLDHPSVRRLSSEEFDLVTGRPWPVEADGELLGETPLRGRVLPEAIEIKI
ncbi:MAG: YegS/Rv2252/BmrU family lipid kinase [Actinomycetota bacterium]|nr:YegS/Rv2252/BmrU family lipid kinase [Actinomycetota bacterium]